MAWFGEGFSSLKGQLTNFAKGVLVEDGENETGDERPKTSQQTTSSSSHINGAPIKAFVVSCSESVGPNRFRLFANFSGAVLAVVLVTLATSVGTLKMTQHL
ncbi:hypothetical protein AAG570_001659 [Ranatra chinensis]|uniref:Uncharacterized protein n=1 Tax=Ranatra chinensis TaxID=642074 RepID=A0ABD0YB45_9HEMI